MRTLATFTILLAVVPAAALADGWMAPRLVKTGEATEVVTSPKQEAVLIFDGRTVQVILRTHFRAGPKEVAWFVPVPEAPTDVTAGRDRIFTALHRGTVPRFYTFSGGGKKLGCSSGASRTEQTSVVVESRGTAGIYDWVVLEGKDVGDLVEWLKANRFAVPEGAEQAFRRYVDGGWHWLAMKVRPELTEAETVAPHPVVYTYEATELVYPLAISRLSAALETEVVLYVLADGRYRPANWADETIVNIPVSRSAAAPSGTTYEEAFLRATDERGGRLFVTECARDLHRHGRALLGLVTQRDPYEVTTTYLTRLRAVVSLRAMDRDVRLVPHPEGDDWVTNEFTIRVSAAGDDGDAADAVRLAGLGASAVLGLVLLRRKRLVWRVGAIGCLVGACLIVAT
jgi:hypothetical protein